ncbi:hypothetical protein D9M68_909880 [compost metagenome]
MNVLAHHPIDFIGTPHLFGKHMDAQALEQVVSCGPAFVAHKVQFLEEVFLAHHLVRRQLFGQCLSVGPKLVQVRFQLA